MMDIHSYDTVLLSNPFLLRTMLTTFEGLENLEHDNLYSLTRQALVMQYAGLSMCR